MTLGSPFMACLRMAWGMILTTLAPTTPMCRNANRDQSHLHPGGADAGASGRVGQRQDLEDPARSGLVFQQRHRRIHAAAAAGTSAGAQDRKSTRLNSSHVKI